MEASKTKCYLFMAMVLATVIFSLSAKSQDRYFTKTGTINFSSKTELENIDATNKLVTAVLDTKSGAIQFSVPMKAFGFRKALMQEHFNENYVESDKFPNGSFKGKIINNNTVKYGTNGNYEVDVNGELTIHGVTNTVSTKAKLMINSGSISASTGFTVLLADYKISVPSLVADKISKSVQVTVLANLEPVKK